MAVGNPSFLEKGDSTGAGTTVLSNTFSVTDGDILIVFCYAGGNATAADNDISSVVSTGQSPSSGDFTVSSGWTILQQDQQAANPYFTGAIAWAIASQTNASATITMTTAGSTSARWVDIHKVGSGAVTTTPTNYIADATNTTSTTPSATLPSTPTTGSSLIAGYGWFDPASGSLNAWADGTEMHDEANGADNLRVSSYYVDGSNGATFDPVPTVGTGSLSQQILLMVEMEESVSGIIVTPATGPWYGADGKQAYP